MREFPFTASKLGLQNITLFRQEKKHNACKPYRALLRCRNAQWYVCIYLMIGKGQIAQKRPYLWVNTIV